MIRLFRRTEETWEALHGRVLSETALYLERGLRDRSWGERIPIIPVGKGSFSKVFSTRFWQHLLFDGA